MSWFYWRTSQEYHPQSTRFVIVDGKLSDLPSEGTVNESGSQENLEESNALNSISPAPVMGEHRDYWYQSHDLKMGVSSSVPVLYPQGKAAKWPLRSVWQHDAKWLLSVLQLMVIRLKAFLPSCKRQKRMKTGTICSIYLNRSIINAHGKWSTFQEKVRKIWLPINVVGSIFILQVDSEPFHK